MIYEFCAYGHENILATHKTTLEFTKEAFLTKRGDCVIGVNANFDLKEIKEFISSLKRSKIRVTVETPNGEFCEEIFAEISPNFNSDSEMVIRKYDFISDRTLAINASKAARGLKRSFISYLRQKDAKIIVTIIRC